MKYKPRQFYNVYKYDKIICLTEVCKITDRFIYTSFGTFTLNGEWVVDSKVTLGE